jgi:hypothetical protein
MKKLLIILGLAIWVILMVLMPPEAPAEAKPVAIPAVSESAKSGSRRPAGAAIEKPNGRPKVRMAAEDHREEVRGVIDAAVVTYAPEGVKAIRPYLGDADPEIRSMAREGMVQLGEPDAIPLLREAAVGLKDQSEIASLHEAADLLALPAWSSSEEAATVIAEIMDDTSR